MSNFNSSELSNLILECIDYFKSDLVSISNSGQSEKNAHYTIISDKLTTFLEHINTHKFDDNLQAETESRYIIHIMYTDDCQMENIRAYQLLHQLQQFCHDIETMPADLIGDEQASSYIKSHGITITFKSFQSYDFLLQQIDKSSYIKTVSLNKDDPSEQIQEQLNMSQTIDTELANTVTTPKTSVVSVNVQKLDKLMDLVGELVIAEAMVANTIQSYAEDNQSNIMQINQLRKITSDLQDTIMSIRMVPLSPVFHKMRRITRDMCNKLNKSANINIIGEETEIDKSVIDQISDPLMHIIRNSIDHGIENSEERLDAGKSAVGTVTLEARNIGSDVLLIISDDGRGINKDRLKQKAIEAGLLQPSQEVSERDIFQLVFHPGLSTKEEITEFSGRGVGMDVVASNIERIGGTIYIESEANVGTTLTIKIPLTLAIIDGMNVRVGQSHFTVPTTSIKESFRPSKQQIIHDISGQSMVMVRGEIYSVLNIGQYFSIPTQYSEPHESILLMVEQEQRTICIQVDELVGQQQVVIKPLPPYLKNFAKTNRLSGCTLLGDGSISIILNINELMQYTH